MAFARVVAFEGVSADRVAQSKNRVENDPLPDGVSVTEILMLHDAAGERSLVIQFFESEEDYRRGEAVFDAMTPGETPGRRASVDKYEVALRRTA